MIGSVAQATALDRLVAWISEKASHAVTVEELYGRGPEHLGVTEIEVRELVNEGINQGRLTIGGLTNLIQVRKDETA